MALTDIFGDIGDAASKLASGLSTGGTNYYNMLDTGEKYRASTLKNDNAQSDRDAALQADLFNLNAAQKAAGYKSGIEQNNASANKYNAFGVPNTPEYRAKASELLSQYGGDINNPEFRKELNGLTVALGGIGPAVQEAPAILKMAEEADKKKARNALVVAATRSLPGHENAVNIVPAQDGSDQYFTVDASGNYSKTAIPISALQQLSGVAQGDPTAINYMTKMLAPTLAREKMASAETIADTKGDTAIEAAKQKALRTPSGGMTKLPDAVVKEILAQVKSEAMSSPEVAKMAKVQQDAWVESRLKDLAQSKARALNINLGGVLPVVPQVAPVQTLPNTAGVAPIQPMSLAPSPGFSTAELQNSARIAQQAAQQIQALQAAGNMAQAEVVARQAAPHLQVVHDYQASKTATAQPQVQPTGQPVGATSVFGLPVEVPKQPTASKEVTSKQLQDSQRIVAKAAQQVQKLWQEARAFPAISHDAKERLRLADEIERQTAPHLAFLNDYKNRQKSIDEANFYASLEAQTRAQTQQDRAQARLAARQSIGIK